MIRPERSGRDIYQTRLLNVEDEHGEMTSRCTKLTFGLVYFKKKNKTKECFLSLILKNLKRKRTSSGSLLILPTLDT